MAEQAEDKLRLAGILRERGETLRRQGHRAQARLHMEAALSQFGKLDAVLDAVDTGQRIKSLTETAA